MSRLSALLCWSLLVASCAAPPNGPPDGGKADSGSDGGGRDGGDGGNPDAGLELKKACSELNKSRCEFLTRCGLIANNALALRDCLAWLQATSCGPAKWQPRAEPPLNTLRYDGVLAQECVDGWETQGCAAFGNEPPACKQFLSPNAYSKQACYDGYLECIPPTEGVCRGAACVLSCQPRGALGEVCRDNPDCKASLFCRLTNPAGGFGLCTAYGGVTMPCDADFPCTPGLVCSASKCAVPPPPGQPCLGSLCDENGWCLTGADGGCQLRKSEGETCTDDVQCEPSLLCEVIQGQCFPRQLSNPNSVCGLRQTCPSGTVCLGATATGSGVCTAPLDAGADCVSGNDCQAHLACVGPGLMLKCGARQAENGPCKEDRDCQLLYVCRSNSCVKMPVTGEPCTQTASCLFGPCVSAGDGGRTCVEPFGPNAACAVNADCSSNRCVTGTCLPSCTP